MKKRGLELISAMLCSGILYAQNVGPQVAGPVYIDDNPKEGIYGGIAYAMPSHDVDYSQNTMLLELDFSSPMLQLGYRINNNISVEGRLWTSIYCENGTSGKEDDSEQTIFGVYVKPIYPIAKEMDIYALLGYAFINETSPHDFFPLEEGSISWGVGASYDLKNNISIFADFTQFYQESIDEYDHVVDGFNIGISYRF